MVEPIRHEDVRNARVSERLHSPRRYLAATDMAGGVVEAEGRFDLDDAAGANGSVGSVTNDGAEQVKSDIFCVTIVEGHRKRGVTVQVGTEGAGLGGFGHSSPRIDAMFRGFPRQRK